MNNNLSTLKNLIRSTNLHPNNQFIITIDENHANIMLDNINFINIDFKHNHKLDIFIIINTDSLNIMYRSNCDYADDEAFETTVALIRYYYQLLEKHNLRKMNNEN